MRTRLGTRTAQDQKFANLRQSKAEYLSFADELQLANSSFVENSKPPFAANRRLEQPFAFIKTNGVNAEPGLLSKLDRSASFSSWGHTSRKRLSFTLDLRLESKFWWYVSAHQIRQFTGTAIKRLTRSPTMTAQLRPSWLSQARLPPETTSFLLDSVCLDFPAHFPFLVPLFSRARRGGSLRKRVGD